MRVSRWAIAFQADTTSARATAGATSTTHAAAASTPSKRLSDEVGRAMTSPFQTRPSWGRIRFLGISLTPSRHPVLEWRIDARPGPFQVRFSGATSALLRTSRAKSRAASGSRPISAAGDQAIPNACAKAAGEVPQPAPSPRSSRRCRQVRRRRRRPTLRTKPIVRPSGDQPDGRRARGCGQVAQPAAVDVDDVDLVVAVALALTKAILRPSGDHEEPSLFDRRVSFRCSLPSAFMT